MRMDGGVAVPGATVDELVGTVITTDERTVDAAVAPPVGHPRFPLLDALRAVAALMVLLAHAMLGTAGPQGAHVWWNSFFATGIDGVAVFFVISGFLMYRPFVNAQLNGAPQAPIARYLRRRVLRIVPAYWLALTLLAIYPGLPGVFTHDWWKYYFFLSGYWENTLTTGLVVAWTLGVEVTFYLVLPVYAALVGRLTRSFDRRRAVWMQLGLLALLGAAATTLRYVNFVLAPSFPIQDSLVSLFYWFAVGMALAVVSAGFQGRRLPRAVAWVSEHPARCWGAALVVYLIVAAFIGRVHAWSAEQEMFGYYLGGGLFAVLLVMPAVLGDHDGRWPRRVMAWPLLSWLGLISYGVYLYHVPVLAFVIQHWFQGFGSVAVLGLGLTVVLATASYYLVERPILRFK